MARRPYAGEVTKAYLQRLGVEYVSTDGKVVIWKGKQKKIIVSKKAKKPYGKVQFHDPELYKSVSPEERHDNSGKVNIDIHVLNYVWNVADKPLGMVIDHKDNDPTNNDISNLQMLTQRENLAKDRTNWYVKEVKCDLSKPRSFYQDKLDAYLLANEQAKKDGDLKAAHKIRSNISYLRAQLRYYDKHIVEALELQKAKEAEEACKREYRERAIKIKELKTEVDSARKFYKELRNAYGKDDPIVKQYWGEWKLAIANYHGFCAKTKQAV